MLTALAARLAMGLRLNFEDSELGFLARESCRRTMWSLYLIDTVMAAGYQEFSLSSSHLLHIRLPASDVNFDMDIPQEGGYLHSTRRSEETETSALALLIRLMELRQRILQFTKASVARSSLSPDFSATFDGFQNELEEYLARLPGRLRLSIHNIKLHAHSTTLSRFLAIHTIWHGCLWILNRLTLNGIMEAFTETMLQTIDPAFVSTCQDRCFKSTKSMADILGVILNLRVANVPLDIDVGVTLYQGLRILIHSSQIISERDDESPYDIHEQCVVFSSALWTLFPDCDAIHAIVSLRAILGLW